MIKEAQILPTWKSVRKILLSWFLSCFLSVKQHKPVNVKAGARFCRCVCGGSGASLLPGVLPAYSSRPKSGKNSAVAPPHTHIIRYPSLGRRRFCQWTTDVCCSVIQLTVIRFIRGRQLKMSRTKSSRDSHELSLWFHEVKSVFVRLAKIGIIIFYLLP